jgi:hypothetical protein
LGWRREEGEKKGEGPEREEEGRMKGEEERRKRKRRKRRRRKKGRKTVIAQWSTKCCQDFSPSFSQGPNGSSDNLDDGLF